MTFWMRVLSIVFLLGGSFAFGKGKWVTYEDCEFVKSRYFDGDSFSVKAPTRYTYIFRLYGVDCAETDERIPERNMEQAEEFGIEEDEVLEWGEKAKEFTEEFLSKPFVVHTKKEKAMGASKKARYYAIIENAEGKRLDEALVEAGLARVRGRGVEWPERSDVNRFFRKLRTLEKKAKKAKRGVWAVSKN